MTVNVSPCRRVLGALLNPVGVNLFSFDSRGGLTPPHAEVALTNMTPAFSATHRKAAKKEGGGSKCGKVDRRHYFMVNYCVS